MGSFAVTTGDDGVCVVTFSRPPVNAVSLSVYEDIGRLVDQLQDDEAVRAIVLTAPDEARAWCGGADLNDAEQTSTTLSALIQPDARRGIRSSTSKCHASTASSAP